MKNIVLQRKPRKPYLIQKASCLFHPTAFLNIKQSQEDVLLFWDRNFPHCYVVFASLTRESTTLLLEIIVLLFIMEVYRKTDLLAGVW